jgi:flagellar hook protein FlgE
MSSSIYSGVSGLRSQQTKLDVIGNNIANISTPGYKSQRVTFNDMFSQLLSGANGPSASTNRGGTNPMQVGLGVNVGAISTNMTNGTTQTTGNSMDVAIGGGGFFVVKSGYGSEYEFTRAGNFGVDESGNLTVNGLKVCGWNQYTTDANGSYVYNTQTAVEPLNVFADSMNGNKRVIPPKASAAGVLVGNLDPAKKEQGTDFDKIGDKPAEDAQAVMQVYDPQGNRYDVQIKMSKCFTKDGVTSWYWQAVSPSDKLEFSGAGSGYLKFDKDGRLITNEQDKFATAPVIKLKPAGSVGAGSFEVKLNMSGLSTYIGTGGNKVTAVTDGYQAGELSDIGIGSDGAIIGSYNNGVRQPLGKIAMASFANPAGLEKVGNNLYKTTTNSGGFTGGVEAGASGTGALISGALEGSNVDLAEQFSDMMITERAYQANSKIITTSDTMMETLINMVR